MSIKSELLSGILNISGKLIDHYIQLVVSSLSFTVSQLPEGLYLTLVQLRTEVAIFSIIGMAILYIFTIFTQKDLQIFIDLEGKEVYLYIALLFILAGISFIDINSKIFNILNFTIPDVYSTGSVSKSLIAQKGGISFILLLVLMTGLTYLLTFGLVRQLALILGFVFAPVFVCLHLLNTPEWFKSSFSIFSITGFLAVWNLIVIKFGFFVVSNIGIQQGTTPVALSLFSIVMTCLFSTLLVITVIKKFDQYTITKPVPPERF